MFSCVLFCPVTCFVLLPVSSSNTAFMSSSLFMPGITSNELLESSLPDKVTLLNVLLSVDVKGLSTVATFSTVVDVTVSSPDKGLTNVSSCANKLESLVGLSSSVTSSVLPAHSTPANGNFPCSKSLIYITGFSVYHMETHD